ncbi:acyl-CoA carboxylase subunit epsilon [Streptomyces sp. E11-3]|uniref:acyl-CoA carboxylase subunit epsilon n=1 Tax=Streptomyces sp. E11-3 TaxID=3110112 RepID=UPI00397F7943
MHDHLRIVHGSPTAVELAAVTAALSTLLQEAAVGHHRPRRADWDRSWRPHPAPHSWCTRGNGPPLDR